MPTLNWIGKDKVVTHHQDVPYRVLKKKYTFGNNPESGNKIIHGDNLEALKALLPEYEGRIKCIYIDPPYNTGNEGWVYNDNVNDPHIRKWLGKVVGSEADDLTRHDKWLCMMYPRLVLLQRLLSDDGVLFISIDDNELANLRVICDEIFGKSNFVDYFSWNKTETPANLSHKTKKAIEYIICYTKKQNSEKFRGLLKSSASNNGLMNQTNAIHELLFPAGKVQTKLADGVYPAGKYGTSSYDIELLEDTEVKEGIFITPVRLLGRFKWGQENLENEILKGTIISIKTIAFSPSYDKLEYEPEVPWNLISKKFGVATNEIAGDQILQIFGEKVFEFPKPPSLIEYLVNFICNDSDIILDSFAGSGTTAHAVLNLNKKDGGNRKFILCEMCDYAETITAERVRRVIRGYNYNGKIEEELYSIPLNIKNLLRGQEILEDAQKIILENRDKFSKISKPMIIDNSVKVIGTRIIEEKMDGTGGGFDFYELGETIFDPVTDNLNDNADIEQIRRYIWYCETNTAYYKPNKDAHPYLLGSYQQNNYYFYYIIGKETCLDWDFLNTFTQKDKAEMYIIYADRCVLTQEEMMRMNIRFKKIPHDIKRV